MPADLANLFLRELASRGIPPPEAQPDGTFVLQVNDTRFTVSLHNLARDFARDHDAGRISRFVDTILAIGEPLPGWPAARTGTRFSAEPSDHDFGESLYDAVSDAVCRVLAYVDSGESRITWLTP